MVAFNFKPYFADDVQNGVKLRTIRQKRRASPGDALQLYTGMMHKNCRKLRDATCTQVSKIEIDENSLFYAGRMVDAKGRDKFAKLDGFPDWEAMVLWFKKQYPKKEFPIEMYLHEWNPL